MLWFSALATWGGVTAAAAGRATVREWVISVLAALATTQGAIYATCVARRLDRMYSAVLADAMRIQAMTQQTQDGHGHPRLRLAATGTGPHRML